MRLADDLLTRDELGVLDRSILGEKDYRLEHGRFVLLESMRMYRLEERFEFIYLRFSETLLDRDVAWWEL